MDGKAYLEKVISDRLRAVRELPDGERAAGILLAEIRGLASGLVASGVLSQDDAGEMVVGLRETMQRHGWITVTVVTKHGSASREFGPAYAQRPGTPSLPKVPGVPELRRVVPLVGRTIKQGAVTRTFVSLEVWSEVLILRSTTPRDDNWQPDALRQFHDVRWRWRAWDNTGTQYRSTSSSGNNSSGIGALVFENRAFFPSPPDEADLLTVIAEHPDHQAIVELPLR